MSEELSSTPAPAAPTAAVIDAPQTQTRELGTQLPTPEKAPEPKAEAKPEASSRDAVKRAVEAQKLKAETEKVPAKPEAKGVEKPEAKPAEKADAKTPAERARAEDGKFTPSADKTAEPRAVQGAEGNQTAEGRKPFHEPPARFNEVGKKEWANAPDSVKEEVHRSIKNLEDGLGKYKETAERWDKVKEYDDLARKNGWKEGIADSYKAVVDIEDAFKTDTIKGFQKVADHYGINLQAVAAHIMQQNPNEQVQQAHTRIRELEAKIADMELEQKLPSEIEKFVASKDENGNLLYPRYQELHDDIVFLLESGIITETGNFEGVKNAYKMLDRLKATPAPSATASSAGQVQAPASPAPAALNPAGSKTVSGAPAGGISPASRQPVSKTTGEAVKRAMAQAIR